MDTHTLHRREKASDFSEPTNGPVSKHTARANKVAHCALELVHKSESDDGRSDVTRFVSAIRYRERERESHLDCALVYIP